MDSGIAQENVKKVEAGAGLRETFSVITVTLLSLLLPQAFLLLARLTTAHYLLAYSPSVTETTEPLSLLASFFLYSDGTNFQYVLVYLVTGAALVHGFSGRLLLPINRPVPRSCLYAAWIFLSAFQLCVCLGIEGSIAAGVDASRFGQERGLVSRVVFFLGLHETMLYWSKSVVKPIVDDTLFGFPRKERWIAKVAMALSYGTLWWWRLRDEIESLVVVVEVKRQALMGVGALDFAGWWLYYLTVTIGVVKAVKGLLRLVIVLLCRRRVEGTNGDSAEANDKV